MHGPPDILRVKMWDNDLVKMPTLNIVSTGNGRICKYAEKMQLSPPEQVNDPNGWVRGLRRFRYTPYGLSPFGKI